MPRIAVQLNEDFITQVCQLVGLTETDVLDHVSYIVLTPVGPAEFNVMFMTEDQIYAEAAADPELEITTL